MNLPNPINNNDNINTSIEEFDTHLVNSYIDFITTSNTSLHSMLEIINNQQSSFNNILSHHIPASTTNPVPGSIFYNIYDPYIINRTRPTANRTGPTANRTGPTANRTGPTAIELYQDLVEIGIYLEQQIQGGIFLICRIMILNILQE